MTHRILHVLDHSIPLQSGYTFRTLSILRQQRKLGWQTFHLTSPKQRETASDEENIDGVRFFRTPPNDYGNLGGLREWRMMRHVERRLEDVVRRVRPDILHAHSPVLNAIPALRVGRRLGVPVVYEIRAFWEDAAVDHGTAAEGGLRYRLTRAIETYASRRAGHVTTICEGLKDDLVRRGLDADRITVIPNAVDVDAFETSDSPGDPLRDTYGLRGAFVVGFIGSFYAYEGIALLIAALPQLVKQVPNVRLMLVGGGPEEQALKHAALRSGFGERVIFAGRVPQHRVNHFYDLADVMVYPRHAVRLTELVTPLKPLEAMAKRRLVIASAVGGHRELIRHDFTGVLFPPDDVRALTVGIASIAADSARYESIRQRAYDYVKRERTWANSVKRYETVYTSLINASGRPRYVVEAQRAPR